MQVLYDNDAVYFTAWLERQLIRAGFLESATDCEEVLQQLEGDLNIWGIAGELYNNDDRIGALHKILWPLDQSDWISLSRFRDPYSFLPFPFYTPIPLNRLFDSIERATAFLREFIIDASDSRRADYWQLVREAASLLQQREYRIEVPLNLVATISVLHRLVVVPRLNFEDSNRRMQRIVKAEITIVDDDGTVVLDRSQAESQGQEVRDFWRLFETVEQEFSEPMGISERPRGDDLGLARETIESLDEFINRRASGMARRMMALMLLNRGEA